MPFSQLSANDCVAHAVESIKSPHRARNLILNIAIAVAVAAAMAKRKNRGAGLDPAEPTNRMSSKRAKSADQLESVAASADGRHAVDHALLKQYYSQTTTLREYVLTRLPTASRLRRKKIASVGRAPPSLSPTTRQWTEGEITLARLLDTTLVASRDPSGSEIVDEAKSIPNLRWEQWVRFSQRGGDESYVSLSDGLRNSLYSQAEVGANHTDLHPDDP